MKKFKENNKGFSLVELIVVIAIMVVLIAVLGSTILGYVEKSKYGKDKQALDALKTALSTYVADGYGTYDDGQTYTLTQLLNQHDKNSVIKNTLSEVFDFKGITTVTSATGSTFTGTATFNGESKAFRDVDSDDVYIQIDNGAVSIYVKSNEGGYDDYVVGSGSSIAPSPTTT